MSTGTIEELMGSNDTEKKVETIFGDLENKGEIPPKTAETIESIFSEDTEELITSLRTAYATEHSLDKEQTSYNLSLGDVKY